MEPDPPGDVAGDESDEDGRGLGGLGADGTVPSGDSTGVAELAGIGALGVVVPLSGDGTGAEGGTGGRTLIEGDGDCAWEDAGVAAAWGGGAGAGEVAGGGLAAWEGGEDTGALEGACEGDFAGGGEMGRTVAGAGAGDCAMPENGANKRRAAITRNRSIQTFFFLLKNENEEQQQQFRNLCIEGVRWPVNATERVEQLPARKGLEAKSGVKGWGYFEARDCW